MFIRKSRGRDTTSYQLVRSYRDNGKPKQEVLVHLGEHTTVEDAMENWSRRLSSLRAIVRERKAEGLKGKLDTLRKLVKEHDRQPCYSFGYR